MKGDIMAKIHEEVIVIKLSKLIKNNSSDQSSLVNEDIHAAIEQVVQELVGDEIIVEVEVA